MNALHHASTREVVDERALLGAVGGSVDELDPAGAGDAHLGVLVDVSVGVAGDRDGLLPAFDLRLDTVDLDGGAEHGAVEHGADGAVGALPHLFEAVLLDARRIGGDGGALDGDPQSLGCLSGIDGYLVVRLVTVLEAEVVVLGIEVDEGRQQLVLDDLPDDASHLVAVHLDERGLHLNLVHDGTSQAGSYAWVHCSRAGAWGNRVL